MAEETAFENDRIYNFEGLVTLTLDRVILHTIIDLYLNAKFHWNQRSFFVNGRTYVYTYVLTDVHLRPALLDSVEEST